MVVKSLVKFPSKVETNSGGGSSLYEAAAQHSSLGRENWVGLRKYCHGKLGEWWQWYQPYYSFPLQVTTLFSLQHYHYLADISGEDEAGRRPADTENHP